MPENIEEKERFQITDLGSLNWTFREKIIPLNAEIERNKAFAKSEIDRITKWLEEENKSHIDSVAYFETLIQDYHYRTLLEDPKAKTISTPYGKSKSRVSKAQPAVADKGAMLDHILANDMREFIKEDAIWGEFKKTLSVAEVVGVSVAFDRNGQAVPGVVIKPESVSYTVEVT